MVLRAARAASARSDSLARLILGPRNDQNEENSPNTKAEGTSPSRLNVLLQALTA